MMAHTAEAVGLAAFSLVGSILDELEAQHPGSKAKILERAKAVCQAGITSNPGGNGQAILEVIKMIK